MTAAALGVDGKNVVLHQQYCGTGFGRRLEPDGAIISALAAQQIGRPVKLVYTREDDLRFDFHQTHTVQRVKGGVNAAGKSMQCLMLLLQVGLQNVWLQVS